MIRCRMWLPLMLGMLFSFPARSLAQPPFGWNTAVPRKTPAEGNDNGKLVLFDVSHGGTQGNADWVIDGGFSDFADALVREGFTVEEYRGVDLDGDGLYRFVDDRADAHAANEAIITLAAIRRADVLVLAETNRPFRQDEYEALKQFVAMGKGIYFIADHYNADRNLNTWDSTEVFNGYNRSDLDQYNMAPHYGDQRNPKDANKGWLAENFGLRFRFNALDRKAGASDLVPAANAEGLTLGAGPVLIAAGASLAITDPGRAKGLVYFSDADNVQSWQNAVEGPAGGKYFGGAAEGPVVAISKPSAGKAAFLGDSSPVEDITWRYRRENNGRTKRLHAGWTSDGNAAQLSINIVKWLATPEPYVGFDSPEHPPGIATPQPMAAVEEVDPDHGQPWSHPSGGYDPWDASTFHDGAYGAPHPSSEPLPTQPGDPPAGPRISVAQALLASHGASLTVKGRVSDAFNTKFGLRLADLDEPSKSIVVKLPKPFRPGFNPLRNPGILNQTIVVAGRRDKYANEPGMIGVLGMGIENGPPANPSSGVLAERTRPFDFAAPVKDSTADDSPHSHSSHLRIQTVRVPDGRGGQLLIIIVPEPKRP